MVDHDQPPNPLHYFNGSLEVSWAVVMTYARGAVRQTLTYLQFGPEGAGLGGCVEPISYRGHRFPPDVIRQAVWLYFRFTLSFRDVEELLAGDRGQLRDDPLLDAEVWPAVRPESLPVAADAERPVASG